jgi:uncharacterized protein (TIGR02996 family)
VARFEDAKTFIHVTRSGTSVVVTAGPRGRKGRTTSKTFASIGAAQAHHDDLVLAKLRDGFTRVEDALEPPATAGDSHDDRLEALEARIVEDPADAEAWMVYGDLLQRHGDPRGEFAALLRAAEAARAANPRARSSAQLAAVKFFAKHAAALLGPLARYVPSARDPLAPPFIWRHGTIYRAELASGEYAPGEPLDELLAHRSGRLLCELAVRADSDGDATAVLAAIVLRGAPALQELDLAARAHLEDLDALWAAIPQLRRLSLTARSIELDALAMPALQRARFFATALSSRSVQAIAAAPWPQLERLELRLGNRPPPAKATRPSAIDGGGSAEFADLAALLSRSDMPALTHLKLRNAPFAGAIARAIAAGPLAERLVVLDLCHGSMTPNDTRALAAAKSRFPNLRELWVPAAAGERVLAGVAKHVILDSRAPVDTLDEELWR